MTNLINFTEASLAEVKSYMSADVTILAYMNQPEDSVDSTPEQILRVIGDSGILFNYNS